MDAICNAGKKTDWENFSVLIMSEKRLVLPKNNTPAPISDEKMPLTYREN